MDDDDIEFRDAEKEWMDFIRSPSMNQYRYQASMDWERHPSITIPIPKLPAALYYELMNAPEVEMRSIQIAATEICNDGISKDPSQVQVITEGLARRTTITDLRARDLGRLVTMEGIVQKATAVSPRAQEITFRCRSCGTAIPMAQYGRIIRQPVKCQNPDCRTTKNFERVDKFTVFEDSQYLLLNEMPESNRGNPQGLTIDVTGILCGKILPGTRVSITGILASETKNEKTLFTKYLRMTGFSPLEEDYSNIEITEEDIRLFETIKPEDIYRSISPSIHGHENIKRAIAMMMAGGISRTLKDGTYKRGDIHALLIGDPGTAKSVFLRNVSQTGPRSIFTSGRSSSAGGLTAVATKDEFGDGRWTLEAGALVLADMGMACIDEIGQMTSRDHSAMHEAMEQQTISIAKAGIVATLKSRCSILAAGNPKQGRFDPMIPIAEQFALSAPLLSRFDLIYAVQDIIVEETDEMIADQILFGDDEEPDETILDPLTLRKFFAYVKGFSPKLSKDAKQSLRTFYVKTRALSAKSRNTPVPMTPRQMDGLVRLTEAHARIRRSTEATPEDAAFAIQIMDDCLKGIAYDPETGTYDIDTIATGFKKTDKELAKIIKKSIEELSQNGMGTDRGTLYTYMESSGYDRGRVEAVLEKLIRETDIMEPKRNHVRVV